MSHKHDSSHILDQVAQDRAATIIAALDSTLRLNILLKLQDRDHVVHELVSALDKSQPLVSQHLRVLKEAGLVSSRRSGREVIYSLTIPETTDVISLAAEVGKSAELVLAGEYDELATRRERNLPPEGEVETGKAAMVSPDRPLHPDVGLLPDMPQPPAPDSK